MATVVQAPGPVAFTELVEECGLPRSTTSRLLTALERTDLLDQTAALPAGGNAAGMPLQPRKAEQAGLAA